jgi:hemerythrin
MHSLKWSTSHAVWLTEIDDQHREIFEVLANLREVLTSPGALATIRQEVQRLYTCIKEHFAHEERLMRAARYGSLRWHRQQHNSARKRVRQFISDIDRGNKDAGLALIEYLSSWLRDHTGVADRMMCAFLRNERRGIGKLTFTIGTRPAAGCPWVDARGERFDPFRTPSGL